MKYDLLEYLVCPKTQEPLYLKVYKENFDQVESGLLISSKSGNIYPIENYVPRFIDKDEYANTFSKQRLHVKKHFEIYKKDKSGYSLFYSSTGFCEETILKGIVLDVGCGYGRFVDVVQKKGGRVVGIDISNESINIAQNFIGLNKNVNLIQCDLFNIPFKEKIFNSIYSIGVLHHTPDCKKAFEKLSQYLIKDGRISIWVYHPCNQSNVKKWRQYTTKWSSSTLYHWCIINQILFSWIRTIPIIRWKFNKLIPGSVPGVSRNFWLRVMEDFDNLSPKYASTHTPEEVVEWFKEVGLSDVKILTRLTAVTGYRR